MWFEARAMMDLRAVFPCAQLHEMKKKKPHKEKWNNMHIWTRKRISMEFRSLKTACADVGQLQLDHSKLNSMVFVLFGENVLISEVCAIWDAFHTSIDAIDPPVHTRICVCEKYCAWPILMWCAIFNAKYTLRFKNKTKYEFHFTQLIL